MGRGKGASRQYASTDVRAGKGEKPYFSFKLPYDPRSYDAKGKRIGELPKTSWTKAEWDAEEAAADKRGDGRDDQDVDVDHPYEDEHTDQNMDP
jgi:hypothetical protein